MGVIGFGYTGQELAKRLDACGMLPRIYDPHAEPEQVEAAGYELAEWPTGLERLDFLVFCCALTARCVSLQGSCTALTTTPTRSRRWI